MSVSRRLWVRWCGAAFAVVVVLWAGSLGWTVLWKSSSGRAFGVAGGAAVTHSGYWPGEGLRVERRGAGIVWWPRCVPGEKLDILTYPTGWPHMTLMVPLWMVAVVPGAGLRVDAAAQGWVSAVRIPEGGVGWECVSGVWRVAHPFQG